MGRLELSLQEGILFVHGKGLVREINESLIVDLSNELTNAEIRISDETEAAKILRQNLLNAYAQRTGLPF